MIRALTTGLLLATFAAPAFAAAPEKDKDKGTSPKAKADAEACDCDCGKDQRVFELRTYYTNEGKLGALHSRFRDHTNRLFKKHKIEIVGFWVPQDEKDGKKDKLVYLIAFPSREAAAASWEAFRNDPEWHKVARESEKDGKLVKKVESVFLDPADYSPIK